MFSEEKARAFAVVTLNKLIQSGFIANTVTVKDCLQMMDSNMEYLIDEAQNNAVILEAERLLSDKKE